MEINLDELEYVGIRPDKIGDERRFSPFIGRTDTPQIGEVVDRTLMMIKDNIAYVKYSIKTLTPDDEYADARTSLVINKYHLEGTYADYSSIPEAEREELSKENEEIFELFSEVVKESIQNEHRAIKPRIAPEVLTAIEYELDYQDEKWGYKEQSLPGYLLIMKQELDEAIAGWMKNAPNRNSPLHEIVQVVAVGIQCLEQYGTMGCTINTNDIRDDKYALSHLVHLATTPGFTPVESTAFTDPNSLAPYTDLKNVLGDSTTVDEILAANGIVHMEHVNTTSQIEEKA